MATSYATQQIPTDGIIWMLDASNIKSYVSGSTYMNQLISGQTFNGEWPETSFYTPTASIESAPTFDGTFLTLDGTDDLIEMHDAGPAYNFSPTGSLTIEWWGQMQSGSIGRTMVRKMKNSSGAPEDFTGWALACSGTVSGTGGDRFTFVIRPDAHDDQIQARYDVNEDFLGVHQYVATYDGSKDTSGVRLYKDGVPLPVTTTTNNLTSDSYPVDMSVYPLMIGGVSDNSGNPAAYKEIVKFGKLTLWNRVLTPQQVKDSFDSQRGRFGV